MIQKNLIIAGMVGGVIAGAVFGVMMGMMGMLPMVAKLAGASSAGVGFIVHLVFSAIIGTGFGIVFGKTAAASRGVAAGLGLLYGIIWWFLGPLVIMPVWLGMGVQLSAAGMTMALPSLWGHLIYGLILGILFPLLAKGHDTHQLAPSA